MTQKLCKGQVVYVNSRGYNLLDILQVVVGSHLVPNGHYLVVNPFVQLCYREYPPKLRHLQRNNLIQEISRDKFLRCILRDGAEDYDKIVFISEKFGKIPVVLNKERTHCYFSYKGKFFKSKIWVDKLGVIYGACAGNKYGVYDK
jgi:hypothetical protein